MEPDLIIVRTVLVCMGNYVGQSDHENTAGCTAEYSCTASSVRTDTTPLPPPTDSSRPSSGIH